MAGSKGGKKGKRQAPKWQRLGYSSYRQYLNARYKELGFKSYSDYTHKRERGETPSTKLRHSRVTPRELPPVAGLTRISYESECPFTYKIGQMRGAALVTWLQGVIAHIEKEHPPESIFSGAYRLFGRLAIKLDDNGRPIFEPGLREFWISHMDWRKMVDELYSIARAFGDHKFERAGFTIGRTGSKIFALIIKKVRISVVVVDAGKEKPKGPIWRVLKRHHGAQQHHPPRKRTEPAENDAAYCEIFKGPHEPLQRNKKECAGCGKAIKRQRGKWVAVE